MKLAGFLYLVHSLLEPVLRWRDVFEEESLFKYDRCKRAKVDKSKNICLIPLKPRVDKGGLLARYGQFLYPFGELLLPIRSIMFF